MFINQFNKISLLIRNNSLFKFLILINNELKFKKFYLYFIIILTVFCMFYVCIFCYNYLVVFPVIYLLVGHQIIMDRVLPLLNANLLLFCDQYYLSDNINCLIANYRTILVESLYMDLINQVINYYYMALPTYIMQLSFAIIPSLFYSFDPIFDISTASVIPLPVDFILDINDVNNSVNGIDSVNSINNIDVNSTVNDVTAVIINYNEALLNNSLILEKSLNIALAPWFEWGLDFDDLRIYLEKYILLEKNKMLQKQIIEIMQQIGGIEKDSFYGYFYKLFM